jgi:adenylate cyclase
MNTQVTSGDAPVAGRFKPFMRALLTGGAVAFAGPLVVPGLVDRAYRRLGPRYPAVALSGEFFAAYPFIAITTAVLGLYVGMSAGEFLRIFLVFAGFQLLYTGLIATRIRGELAPITAWLAGAREPKQTLSAWNAAASLPIRILRLEVAWPYPVVAVTWFFDGLACAYATWELGLPASDGLIVFGASFIYLAGVAGLRFFLSERVLQPVIDEIATSLPPAARVEPARLPLRWRLLVALPVINVLTGVVAVGITGAGDLTPSDLGLAVIVSLGLAGTVSLVPTVLLADSVTRPIGRLREAAGLVGAGDFTASVPVTTTDETADLARSFNEMVAGLAERERIREAFGTYVDRDVAEHILREGTSLEGEEVEVTMMFIDVRDFTGFAERSSAPEVVATLNRLFECIVPLIHEHGGHVDKFVGDGLLAVFGAPRRQEDHADQALAAAQEIDRAVHSEMGGELEIGIGLNSGRVVAGNVGGAGRLEFSVIGDAVNVAARVEAATRETGDVVLLAENVKRLLQNGRVSLEARPSVPLKGKREPVMLYAPR